jgi:hypothetical protein
MTILTKVNDFIAHAQTLAADTGVPLPLRRQALKCSDAMTATLEPLEETITLAAAEVRAELDAQKEAATPATDDQAGETTPAPAVPAGETTPTPIVTAPDPTPAVGDAASASAPSATTASATAAADPAPAAPATPAVDPMAVTPTTVDHSPTPAPAAEAGSVQ